MRLLHFCGPRFGDPLDVYRLMNIATVASVVQPDLLRASVSAVSRLRVSGFRV